MAEPYRHCSTLWHWRGGCRSITQAAAQLLCSASATESDSHVEHLAPSRVLIGGGLSQYLTRCSTGTLLCACSHAWAAMQLAHHQKNVELAQAGDDQLGRQSLGADDTSSSLIADARAQVCGACY